MPPPRPDRLAARSFCQLTDHSRPEARCQAAAWREESNSPVAAALRQARLTEQSLPARSLVIIGTMPTLDDHTIYAGHPRRLTGQMRRGPAQTRHMLEIRATDTTADPAGQRVRGEPAVRPEIGRQLDEVAVSGGRAASRPRCVTATHRDIRRPVPSEAAID